MKCMNNEFEYNINKFGKRSFYNSRLHNTINNCFKINVFKLWTSTNNLTHLNKTRLKPRI